MIAPLTEPEAVEFFAHVFRGKHRIPGKVRGDSRGCWWCSAYVGSLGLSTYDDDMLTRIVFAAHASGLRAFIAPSAPRYLCVGITRRDPNADRRHPTLMEAVEKWQRENAGELT
jgi:hypothetical protein